MDVLAFYDLRQENIEFAEEFRTAFERVLTSGRFVFGPELAGFEQQLGAYLGVNSVVGLKSGTDALYFGLKALGIGTGDEVLTSPFTFPATVEAILRTGARPVLVDIEPETLILSPELCPDAITGKTRAILLVHLFGNCADIDRFISLCQGHNLMLIEDAAQAIGSEYRGKKLGGFGQAAAFSFYPTKNLGALGNGGALVGPNLTVSCPDSARLDELQAAFLSIKLKHLDRWLARRRALARRYQTALAGYVPMVQSAPDSLPNYHQFAILTPHRDQLQQFLAQNRVQTMVYYPLPIHRQPRFASFFTFQQLPVAEKASAQILCLPIRQNLTDEEQEAIISSVMEFFNRL